MVATLVLTLSCCNAKKGEYNDSTVNEQSSVHDIEVVSELSNPIEAEPQQTASLGSYDVGDEPTIVWLGDSLTQGSLGERNDNIPNAPYERLKKLVAPIPVEGYGLYGYDTYYIFDTYYIYKGYLDEWNNYHGVDINNIYVIWVGSNDWVNSGKANSETQPVINEIDKFLTDFGDVEKYVVIGTTSRYEIGDLYLSINNDLRAHYGEHYLDIISVIDEYGYSEDQVHLSQASYDAVAEAVFRKLKTLGYI